VNELELEKLIDNSLFLKKLEKESASLFALSKSIKQLQTIIPDLLDKINDKTSIKLDSSLRNKNLQWEKYLKKLINKLNKKEIVIQKKKEILEKEVNEMKKAITSKQ
jgi:hypothetical protein